MKNNKINTSVLILLWVYLFSWPAARADVKSIDIYYPSVTGNYSFLRLPPRNTDLPSSCFIGMMYVRSTGEIQYCRDNGAGAGVWGPLSFVWSQDKDDIYLTDTTVNPNLKVGIGTKTPEFALTLYNDPGILSSGIFGNGIVLPDNLTQPSRFIWYPRKAAFRAGFVNGTQWNESNIGDYSVAMGRNTLANSPYSTVGGGDNNQATANSSVVVGGQNNNATANYSAVGGGQNNNASGQYAMVYGGSNNQAIADYATIIGGNNNQARSSHAVIIGGENNIVRTQYSVITGGQNNSINHPDPGDVDGYSVIGGGSGNAIFNYKSVISGGAGNTVSGLTARIGGGQNNRADGDYSSLSGGRDNSTSGNFSVIGGGLQNTASGSYAIVGGGDNNTASGNYAVILGGSNNIAAGDYSWAEGRNVQLSAAADRTFAWGYSDDNSRPISITVPDAFIIAPGRYSSTNWNPRIGIQDPTPAAVLEINSLGVYFQHYLHISNSGSGDILAIRNRESALNPNNQIYLGIQKTVPTNPSHSMQVGSVPGDPHLTGGGVWMPVSSRKYKENIEPLTSEEAERTLDQLIPVSFNYKVIPEQRTAGFIAEEVPALLAMKDRKSLTDMDFAAILTKTVQDQEQQIKEQQLKIKTLKQRIQNLKALLSN